MKTTNCKLLDLTSLRRRHRLIRGLLTLLMPLHALWAVADETTVVQAAADQLTTIILETDAGQAAEMPLPPPAQAQPETLAPNTNTGWEIPGVLDILVQEEIIDITDPELQSQIIDLILGKIGSGAVFLPPGPAVNKEQKIGPEESSAPTASSAWIEPQTVHDRFGYYRVPQLSPEIARQLQQSLEQYAKTHYQGLVLDFRGAKGLAMDEVPELARLIPELMMPAVILVDRQTMGASELLAAFLQQARHCIVIGTETRGEPYQMREFQLPSGARLRVPDRQTPGAEQYWPPTSVKPQISIPNTPTAPALAELDRNPDMAARISLDPALQRAADLLVVIDRLTPETTPEAAPEAAPETAPETAVDTEDL